MTFVSYWSWNSIGCITLHYLRQIKIKSVSSAQLRPDSQQAYFTYVYESTQLNQKRSISPAYWANISPHIAPKWVRKTTKSWYLADSLMNDTSRRPIKGYASREPWKISHNCFLYGDRRHTWCIMHYILRVHRANRVQHFDAKNRGVE